MVILYKSIYGIAMFLIPCTYTVQQDSMETNNN